MRFGEWILVWRYHFGLKFTKTNTSLNDNTMFNNDSAGNDFERPNIAWPNVD